MSMTVSVRRPIVFVVQTEAVVEGAIWDLLERGSLSTYALRGFIIPLWVTLLVVVLSTKHVTVNVTVTIGIYSVEHFVKEAICDLLETVPPGLMRIKWLSYRSQCF